MKRILIALLLIVMTVGTLFAAKDKGEPIALALLPFEGDKEFRQSNLEAIGDLFLTYMIRTEAFVIVERSKIDEIIEEQAFALSDFTQDSEVIKIGELLAAQSVLIGRLNRVGGKISLTVRVVDVSTGVSLRAQTIEATSLEKLAVQLERLARSIAENIDVSRIIDRRSRWSIDVDATVVVMGGEFYAAGPSVGVRLQTSNRLASTLYGGALMKGSGDIYFQGGVKFTAYPTNNLGITLQIGLFPGLGVSYKDTSVTFAPMWLYGYNGFAATLGYSFGL